MSEEQVKSAETNGWLVKALDWIERIGNKLPDPAILFLVAMVAIWLLSAVLA